MTLGDPIPPALALIACALTGSDASLNRRIASEIDNALQGEYKLLSPFTPVWSDLIAFDGQLDIAAFLARFPQHRDIVVRCAQEADQVSPCSWRDYLAQRRKEILSETVKTNLVRVREVLAAGGDVQDAFLRAASDCERFQSASSAPRTNADLMAALVADLEFREQQRAAGKLTGIPTGIKRLDAVLDGLQPGQLTVLGARPSVGKTAFGISLLNHVAINQRIPSLFILLEGTIRAILRRFIGCSTGADCDDLRRGEIKKWAKEINCFKERFEEAPLRIVDHVEVPDILEMDRIAAEVRTRVKRHGTQLVVVDYLQKIRASGKHEANRLAIGEVSSRLAQIAQSLDVHIVALAQLNRRAEGENPTVADLAESAHIERDADNILLLDRGDRRVEKCRIIVAKQRDGPLDTVEARFDLQRQAFMNARHDAD